MPRCRELAREEVSHAEMRCPKLGVFDLLGKALDTA